MRSTLIVLAAAAAVLAGCSKPAGPAAPGAAPGADAGPAAAAVAAGPITAAQMPAPRAGLWHSVTTSAMSPKPIEIDICMTGKSIDVSKTGPNCDSLTYARTATGGFTVDGDCPNHGMSAHMHVAAEGDFNTSYATDATISVTTAPGAATTTIKTHNVLTYKGGACTPGAAQVKG